MQYTERDDRGQKLNRLRLKTAGNFSFKDWYFDLAIRRELFTRSISHYRVFQHQGHIAGMP
jgi:hypothetical protein